MSNTRQENSESLSKYWKSHIDQWSDSGLTQTEYCQQNDLSRYKFTYWKSKSKKKNLPVEFVQVSHASQIMHRTGLKLNIDPCVQIEIPDGFSQVTLEQVLKTLKVLR